MASSSNARGAVIVVASQGIQLMTRIIGVVILSRLLPPSAFGLVAMVTAVVGIAGVVSTFGFSLSALAGGETTSEERSNLFWLNGLAGLVGMVVVAACGPFIADFYQRPALTLITAVLSVPFFIGGLTTQFTIELNLQGRWARLAITQAVPGVVALAIASAVAVFAHSYWSLVVQSLVASVVTLALAILLSGWRPQAPRRSVGTRRHLAFGRDTVVVQILNYLASNADGILIGRVLGRTPLGIYNRAYGLAVMPITQLATPLEQVVIPRLSTVGGDGFQEVALRCQRAATFVQLVPISVLAGTAFPLVRVFLGSRWAAASAIIQIQAVGAAASAVGMIFWWMLIARRRTGLIVISEGIIEVAMIIAMVPAVHYGLATIAWVVSLAQVCILLSSAALCGVALGFDMAALARAPLPVLGLASVSSLAADVVARSLQDGPVMALLASLATWCAVWGLGWLASSAVRDDIRLVVSLLASARRGTG